MKIVNQILLSVILALVAIMLWNAMQAQRQQREIAEQATQQMIQITDSIFEMIEVEVMQERSCMPNVAPSSPWYCG